MIQNEWFEDWFDSPYYHLLYKNRSEEEANQFVEKCVEVLATKPNETLLDLACGKGRHSVAFAAHGLDVTGVDLSRESIEYALQSETAFLHFYVHDMRNIFRTNYYDYVCNLFTSFGYFKNQNEHVSAAKSIIAALKPQGKFLIDFVNKNHAIDNIALNKQETIVKGDVTFRIERKFMNNKFIKDISIADGDKQLHFQESVNCFTMMQLTDLFANFGLKLLATYGNYQLDSYNEQHSPRMILIFQK